jgi:hypothetical protein
MIQKQNKHIVTFHGCLSFCYRNDIETKQTQKLLSTAVKVSVIEMIQKQNKHKITYHGCLSFCYRNDTETKQTQKLLTMVV